MSAGAGQGIAPWHMWGTANQVTITLQNNLSVFQTTQLARINYRRPDTWTFLFWMNVLQETAPNISTGQINAFFDLTVGLGRSQVTLPGFCLLSAPVSSLPPITWTNQGIANGLAVASGNQPFVTELPASDIQCAARIFFSGSIDPTAFPFVVEVGALFAPRTHIRPDWYVEHFPGGERGGT